MKSATLQNADAALLTGWNLQPRLSGMILTAGWLVGQTFISQEIL